MRPLVKYHGGKGRIFKWILPFIPNHKTYCEPFGGAGSVLINKEKSSKEIYNDIEPKIVNLMLVVKDQWPDLVSNLLQIEYNEENFNKYKKIYNSSSFQKITKLEQATTTYVVKRMSRGGLGKDFSWSKRIYSTGPSEIHCWNSSLKNIKNVSARLQNVEIKNVQATILLEQNNEKETVFYLDPPYLHDTRKSCKVYDYEMTIEQHILLLNLCLSSKAKIIISGYPSELYNKKLNDWNQSTKKVANHASQTKTKTKMSEVLWMNY